MPMSCPSCGRALATGARCIYCADGGTKFKKKEELAVPKGTTKAPKKSFAVPWKTILVLLLIGGIAYAVWHNPDWTAKFKELIKF